MAKNIFDLNGNEAELFFYKNESYYDGELPSYFHFTKMLWAIRNSFIANNSKINYTIKELRKCENLNYSIYTNKDGKYAWRKLQILNPVLYVDLIRYITSNTHWVKIKQRIKKLQNLCNKNIICASIPVVKGRKKKSIKSSQILEWWEKMEQSSLKWGAQYLYAYTADITDCYPSIYTHTIAWALHNKCIAKEKIGKTILGNEIDKRLQNMQQGQTNGIPQGSVLMAVIAEILLAYADRKLFCALRKYDSLDYKIIRYRDDYKIFVNSKKDGEIIIKELANVLLNLNLKLNSTKTKFYEDIVLASIKSDKYNAVQNENYFISNSPQKCLLRVHHFLEEFPCSKQMAKIMLLINDKIVKKMQSRYNKISSDQCEVLIGICTQIAYKNPSLATNCCQIISTLLSSLPESTAKEIIDMIIKKFSNCMHSTVMKIFLQRILIPYYRNHIKHNFQEKICDCVVSAINGRPMLLWDYSWLNGPNALKKCISQQKIINIKKINNLRKRIKREEIDYFYDKLY